LESTYPKLKFAIIQADVGLKSACEKLIEETIAQLGGLDVIVSNAGTLSRSSKYSF
jgi:NAD(P)-dependent dehydrogenase (short-subunit alcohol dehydrogenase family)